MGSINVALATSKISEALRKGKMVNMGKIMRESGYSKSTSLSPTLMTKTKTYKKLAVPLIDGFQEQITKLKEAILEKDLSNEELRVITYTLDTFIKNYQLLSGGATERQVFVVPSEILERNKIEENDTKKLKDGSS